jgi:ribosome biogenesis GTPase
MELIDLGFSAWFRRKLEESGRSGDSMARVTAVDRDMYLVRNERGEVRAELSGRLLHSAEPGVGYPAVGDWAFVQYYDAGTLTIIDGLLPRKSVLRRKSAGRKVDYQMIASNIDAAFIMQSCDSNFNLRRLERYLVMASDGQIEPILLLSKTDLVSREGLEQRIARVRSSGISCEVVSCSSEAGSGLDQVRQVMEAGRTYCLLGSSGVGKTTLLNHLIGREAFATNPVREKDGRGRHTTARRQLIVLEQGAMLIDTPGMRELGIIGAGAAIDGSFSDVLSLASGCRFNDCTHTNEVGCSVLEALLNGELSEGRYQSYMKLVRESEHHQMSYLEKRRKDRRFGQFIKSAMKHRKKG